MMASSITGTDTCSNPWLDSPHTQASPLRKRIIEESIAANTNQTESKRGRAWTKKPKYEQFQSTLDLKNGLQPLPFLKTRKVHPPSFTLCDESDRSPKDQKRPSRTALGGPSQRLKIVRPPLLEMDQMMENGPTCFVAPDDPLMLELEKIIEASRSTPTPPEPKTGDSVLIFPPRCQPITLEQLAREVKEIYAGLTRVESKCTCAGRYQATNIAADTDSKLPSDHWQSLIALHRTLLQENHDFFLASQHPSASPALRRLAQKYAMPSRMWRCGIQSLLELFRGAPRHEFERMSTFLRSTYDVIGALQENIPSMASEWDKIRGAVMEYETLLFDVRSNPSVEAKHRLPAESARDPADIEFGDLYFQRDSLDEPSAPGLASGPSEKSSPLTQYMVDALSGWLYFGQGLPDRFNIYVKVFSVLSMAAQHWNFLFGSYRMSG